MARKLGRYFRFKIGNGSSPETFTEPAGQTGLTLNGATNMIDQSSKDDYPWTIKAPGRSDLSIQVSGKTQLPDASGLEIVYSNFLAGTAVNCQVCETDASPDATRLVASMYISDFSEDGSDEDNRTYSFTATLAATPTTDDLTP